MNRKLMLFSSLAALATSAVAQSLQVGYIDWPKASELAQYVEDWNAGNLNMEDENFFISRVKPKTRFRNAATQVNTSLNANNDKRLCFWVPITTWSGSNLNALPNNVFDSEVFSNWSYVDAYGNWTSPHGWVPGNFADAAHKNGVGVSGVASIPFGGNSEWSSALAKQAALDNTKLAKFLHYHGVDGLGYNSEFSGNASSVQKIAVQHEAIIEYLTERGNPVAENIWYDGTNYNGSCTFDQGLSTHNAGIFGENGKRRASLFFNYNWNNTTRMASSVNKANALGVSPLYLYCGMNMQGGEPRSNESYPYLPDYNLSLGYWGAHDYNMFWLNRTAKGSAPEVTQATYLYDTERFFTNAAQNPAVKFDIFTQRNHYPSAKFFGMSSFMTARSTLSWDLATEPFVTYFNLGNGAFFNWKGERVSDAQWYNIGVQDYLPTWRYWWAPTLLGRDVTAGQVKMNATFTWEDAYMGGSCMQIEGTDEDAWLHLFKTNFEINRGDSFTFTYKHLAGAGKVSIVFTTVGNETTPVTDAELTFDLTAPSEEPAWETKEITLGRGSLNSALNGKNIALVALHVEGARDLKLNVGEFSIKRGEYSTPATPAVTKAKMLSSHYKGVDGKLIWDMDNDKATDEPVYNLDVKTSLFKIYAREEGGEPVFMGVTTSWAGMVYSAPFDPMSDKKVQLGVSAVSLDFASESEIAWSEPQARAEYTVNNDIEINKTVIKPLEGFEIKFVDPKHEDATWTIYNSSNKKMASATGKGISVANGEGFAEEGGYDLVLNEGKADEHRYGYYVQISNEKVGAMPEIYTISLNGTEVADTDAPVTFELTEDATSTEPVTVSYTGRKADGSASRGLNLRERFFGLNFGKLGLMNDASGNPLDANGNIITDPTKATPASDPDGLQGGQSFSVAFWVRYDEFPAKEWSFFDITNRGGSWPVSNWGYAWHRGDANGNISCFQYRGDESDGGANGHIAYAFNEGYGKLQAQTWTHIAMTLDYQSSTMFRSKLYINGVLQPATFTRPGGGGYPTKPGTGNQEDYVKKGINIKATDWLSLGGLPNGGLAINGTIDDFQIWKKAMTPEDVKTSMAGLDPENLPADVFCMWDFEDEAGEDFSFLSKGSKPGVKAYSFDCVGGDDAQEGQGTQTPFSPSLGSGCPFISGTAYPIVTKPEWSASSRKAVYTEADGTDTEGSAKVVFNEVGDYNLTLTLSNSYGSHSMNFPVISVKKEETGLTGVEAADEVEIHTDADGVLVDFPAAGIYTVAVYDVQGRLVAQRADQVSSSQMMHIRINNAGAYVVRVIDANNGSTLRSAKVIKH